MRRELEFRSEAVYSFAGVPRHLFLDLTSSRAPGRFFANFIKPNYEGTLVREAKSKRPAASPLA